MSTVQPKQTWPRVVGRFISGRALDGLHRTDSTFIRRATKDLTPHGRASRWAHKPGWHRAVIRLGSLAVVILSAYGYMYARPELLATLAACVIVAALYTGIRVRRNAVAWSHNRHVVYPLWHILAGIVGYPIAANAYQTVAALGAGNRNYAARERPDKFLIIPRDYRDNDDAIVRFDIPYSWEAEAGQLKRVSTAIARKLGGEWVPTWHLNESPRYVALCHAPKPPELVLFEQFRVHMDASPSSVLPLGLASGGMLATINLDSEAPHIAISMGTGGGKSVVCAMLLAFLVKNGVERIDIIDPKRVSFNWARGLPGVFIHRYVAGQMEAITNARIRMDGRYEILDGDDSAVFPRHVLIIEEQNSLMSDLKDYWEDYRRDLDAKERAKAPKKNPAIKDLAYILAKGRQCRMNVISIFQRMSAEATGGGDMRENYGAKLMARFSPQTWKMLTGISPIPRRSKIPGRAVFVIGDDVTEIQMPYLTNAEAREYALDGRPDVNPLPVKAEPVMPSGSAVLADGAVSEPDGLAAVSEPDGLPVELLSLREACESGVIRLSYGAARKARSRDSEFPAFVPDGAAKLYRPADLAAWEANRLRARHGMHAA